MGIPEMTPSLASKLASLIVHYKEANSLRGRGHPFDFEAIKTLEADGEVVVWLKEMVRLGFATVKPD